MGFRDDGCGSAKERVALEEHESNFQVALVAPAEGGLRRLGTEEAGRRSISGWAKKVMGFRLRSPPEARGFTVTREKGGVVRVTLAVKTLSRSEIEVFRHDSQLRERQDNIHIHLRVEGL